MWQARLVADLLRAASGAELEVVVIRTSGDRLPELAVTSAASAVRQGDRGGAAATAIDLAVHSMKDMPAVLPEGLRSEPRSNATTRGTS